MHSYYFYVPPEDFKGATIRLRGRQYKHCCKVLRKSSGDVFTVFDGKGHKKDVKLKKDENDSALMEVIKEYPPENGLDPKIQLGIGIVRNKAMDLIINQGTCLGMDEFYPLKTKHTIKDKFRNDRYTKKAIAAAKQCGSSILPNLHESTDLSSWYRNSEDSDLKLIASQEAENNLNDIVTKNDDLNNVSIMVGPEGGFYKEEFSEAIDENFIPVNIFPYRLRTELAVTNLLSAIYHLTN